MKSLSGNGNAKDLLNKQNVNLYNFIIELLNYQNFNLILLMICVTLGGKFVNYEFYMYICGKCKT